MGILQGELVGSSNHLLDIPTKLLRFQMFPYYLKFSLTTIANHGIQKFISKGGSSPKKKWDEWIEKLAGKYVHKRNQVGICDAIMSSRYETQCSLDLVLGLVEFWCPETNTFVFLWGRRNSNP